MFLGRIGLIGLTRVKKNEHANENGVLEQKSKMPATFRRVWKQDKYHDDDVNFKI